MGAAQWPHTSAWATSDKRPEVQPVLWLRAVTKVPCPSPGTDGSAQGSARPRHGEPGRSCGDRARTWWGHGLGGWGTQDQGRYGIKGTRAQWGREIKGTRAQRYTVSSEEDTGSGPVPMVLLWLCPTSPGHVRGSARPLALGTSADREPGLSPRCPTGCPRTTAHKDVSSRSGLLRGSLHPKLLAAAPPQARGHRAGCALPGHEGVKAPGAVLRGRSSLPSLCTSGCNKGWGGRSIPEH